MSPTGVTILVSTICLALLIVCIYFWFKIRRAGKEYDEDFDGFEKQLAAAQTDANQLAKEASMMGTSLVKLVLALHDYNTARTNEARLALLAAWDAIPEKVRVELHEMEEWIKQLEEK